MVSVRSSMKKMSIGARTLMTIHSPDFLCAPSTSMFVDHALQQHVLQCRCAPDVVFLPRVDEVAQQGQQAEDEAFGQIIPHGFLHLFLVVPVGTFGNAGGGEVDEHPGREDTDEVAKPGKVQPLVYDPSSCDDESRVHSLWNQLDECVDADLVRAQDVDAVV